MTVSMTIMNAKKRTLFWRIKWEPRASRVGLKKGQENT